MGAYGKDANIVYDTNTQTNHSRPWLMMNGHHKPCTRVPFFPESPVLAHCKPDAVTDSVVRMSVPTLAAVLGLVSGTVGTDSGSRARLGVWHCLYRLWQPCQAWCLALSVPTLAAVPGLVSGTVCTDSGNRVRLGVWHCLYRLWQPCQAWCLALSVPTLAAVPGLVSGTVGTDSGSRARLGVWHCLYRLWQPCQAWCLALSVPTLAAVPG